MLRSYLGVLHRSYHTACEAWGRMRSRQEMLNCVQLFLRSSVTSGLGCLADICLADVVLLDIVLGPSAF